MLTAAHSGYAYQDLLVATRLVDVIVGTLTTAQVDTKLHADDRFDDLTTLDTARVRQRTQFKAKEDAAPLPLSAFSTDQRDLKLDRLISSALGDRDASSSTTNQYRVLLGHSRPTDPRLAIGLRPCANDPGPFTPGMTTLRLRFDADLLWPLERSTGGPTEQFANTFSFLRAGHLHRPDVVWFCEHFVVEVEAPPASLDLTSPGPAELLLLERVKGDIGAGSYPNGDRAPEDVAAALIGAALAARAGKAEITATALLRRTRLRHDFGAVARAHPIDAAIEVGRPSATEDVARHAGLAVGSAVPLLVVGPPGQGKSWACQRVAEALTQQGWLVAEHYCFLGDADHERQERVHGDRVLGSLLSRLADADPETVRELRPRLAGDDRALVAAIRRARDREPARRVALLVDGLDHVTRVLGSSRPDASKALASRLAGLDLPPGSLVVVFSQPGEHLRPLRDVGALERPMPGLDSRELGQLARKWHVFEHLGMPANPEVADHQDAGKSADRDLIEALAVRSEGNALYATYLCREVLRTSVPIADPAAALMSLPPFDGSLAGYYNHLCAGLDDGAWVADVVALLDFSVTRTELREMRPDIANRIDSALAQLSPVLIERAMQGGIRVYHESFARFWLEVMVKDAASVKARLDQVATWLSRKGLFRDSRSFRFLIPILGRADRSAEAVALVDSDFVSAAVAAGFHASAIRGTLASAVSSAARQNDWAAIVRFVELSRAADAYQEERVDSIAVEYADVAMAILGPPAFAERLLYDGRTTVPARAGIKLCSSIDASGETAPWSEYLDAYTREREDDNTLHGEESEREVALAILRGQLRRTATTKGDLAVDLDRLARYLDEAGLSATGVIDTVVDTLGVAVALALVPKLRSPDSYALALAERLSSSEAEGDRQQAATLVTLVAQHGELAGEAHRLLKLGAAVQDVQRVSHREAQAHLLDLTRAVLNDRIQSEPLPLLRWLDACTIAARCDQVGLGAAEALLVGEGWYRCWLRFVVGLARAEAGQVGDQSAAAMNALKLLADDLRPFAGAPRACDLYQLHSVIHSTVARALALLDDQSWASAVHLLSHVSEEISTTLFGEMGGPLGRDTLIDLVMAGSNSNRHEATSSIVMSALEDGVGRTYYSDVARFHLSAARLALRIGEHEKASAHWRSASALLVAYGFHKDATIYELIDSLPPLIEKDRTRAQRCLEVLQPLCERVVLHTDRKSTGRARSRWWDLLALADPLALAKLTAPDLLGSCNLPYEELEDARTELWRVQHAHADPIVAAALRLTIRLAIDDSDKVLLERLAELTPANKEAGLLLGLLVARADERPIGYSYSNSSDLLAKDHAVVVGINNVARSANIPSVLPFPIEPAASDREDSTLGRWRPDRKLLDVLEDALPFLFPPGTKGLAQAANTWHGRPYDAHGERWATDRFANAIGYRLLEALDRGAQPPDVSATIHAIADTISMSKGDELLCELAQGLERHGLRRQAVLAYTLHWTRTRGHGGWLNFGGETNIDSLRKAALLDPQLTLATLATEVEPAVRSGGTLGISQSIIFALLGAEWGSIHWPCGHSASQLGFAAWDQAAAVIARRLPHMTATDDPDLPYTRESSDPPPDHSINAAFAIATFAGLGHPSREQKRRALVAVQSLAECCPVLAAEAVDVALRHLKEPATLSWLLGALDRIAIDHSLLFRRCEDSLRAFCKSPHLVIRCLARQLLTRLGVDPGPLPVFEPVPELLPEAQRPSLWLPDTEEASPVSEDGLRERPSNEAASGGEPKLVAIAFRETAEDRVVRAERLLPGFREAVFAESCRAFTTEHYKRRIKSQLEHLTSRAEFRWPNALVAPYETMEEVIQRVAGGARLARARAGEVIRDPIAWEAELAAILFHNQCMPLDFERTRIPRPDLSCPPGHGNAIWREIARTSGERNSGTSFIHGRCDDETLAATTVLGVPAVAPSLSEGRYGSWRIVASLENLVSTRARWKPQDVAVTVTQCCALEARAPGDQRALTLPPVGRGRVDTWSSPSSAPSPVIRDTTGPLFVNLDGGALGNSEGGLGYGCTPLAPTVGLRQVLNLRPGGHPFELVDSDNRPALTTLHWRSGYVVSDYELTRPKLCGTVVLARPDVYEQIQDVFRYAIWREYIEGTPSLVDSTGEEKDPT